MTKISFKVTKNNFRTTFKKQQSPLSIAQFLIKKLEKSISSSIQPAKVSILSQNRLEDFLKSRLQLKKISDGEYRIGIFANTQQEYRIILLHEFGGTITITEKMRKWWAANTGKPLVKDFLQYDDLRFIRSVLEDESNYKQLENRLRFGIIQSRGTTEGLSTLSK